MKWRCTLCGQCCKRYTPFVLPDDVERIGESTRWPISRFVTLYRATDFDEPLEEADERYLFRTKRGSLVMCLSRARLPDGDIACVFLRDNMCLVHPFRPFICRQYPFQPEDAMYLEGPFRLINKPCYGRHAEDETVDENPVRQNYRVFQERQESYLDKLQEWNSSPLSNTKDIEDFLSFIGLIWT